MLAFNFGRKVRRVARRQMRRGNLDRETYNKIVTSSRNPETVTEWKAAVEKSVYGAPWLRETDSGWRNIFTEIWEWFFENWPTILKIILSLLVFAGSTPESTSEAKDENKTNRSKGRFKVAEGVDKTPPSAQY